MSQSSSSSAPIEEMNPDWKNHQVFGEYNPNFQAPTVEELCHAHPERLQNINELKKRCEVWIPSLGLEEQKFMTEEGLLLYYRYLSGYGWDKLKEAEEGIKKTCEWRARVKPQNLTIDDLGEVGKSGFLFHYGYDKWNRPIVYIDMKKDSTPMTKENLELKYLTFVYYTENLIKRMPKNVYQISWILDVTGANVSISLVKQMKDTFLDLGIYYCERLALAFVVNVTMSINLIWKFVSSFLAKQTVERYHVFTKDCKKLRDALHHFFDEGSLLKDFHGTANFTYSTDVMKSFHTLVPIQQVDVVRDSSN
ncbi:predicted protein [Naegleria gruberi]|uniref:Predicted protein n=1 Tax=Naegleria gruberi TaxID=5762 RepID=D2W291_NAEGR|nr:uncharacterized protein NAEGRDRAFT_82119 [Naegleria gruberi]EFC36784.1 predicted protein [Naegleria gruberi]|eukprot:XP_002669528.1 predicted protein [Naegleria gruberi strain NEG-M]